VIDLTDPSMKEIVDEFCAETEVILCELESILEDYESHPDGKLFEAYAQKINGIIGNAQLIGAKQVLELSQLGKIIGHKSSLNEDPELNNIVCGILFDLVDCLREALKSLASETDNHRINIDAFIKRLVWLKEKFNHIDKDGAGGDGKAKSPVISSELESLMNNLKDD
tara:strand:+ start:9153 stop:9656 length:504 start_codon:yes stop_codon:yes gene_type:complete